MELSVQTGASQADQGVLLWTQELLSRDGNERAVLLLQVEGEGPAAESLPEEMERIVQQALLESEGEAWNRLDGTLKELNGLIKGLLLSQAISDVHAIVAFVDSGHTLHLSHAGRAEAYLARSGAVSQITEFTKGKPLPAFVHISSGTLESGDVVACCTQRLLRAVTPAQMAQMLLRTDASELLLEKLQMEGELGAIACVRAGRQAAQVTPEPPAAPVRSSLPPRRGRRPAAAGAVWQRILPEVLDRVQQAKPLFNKGSQSLQKASRSAVPFLEGVWKHVRRLPVQVQQLVNDLRHPERKRRAHLLLLAGAMGAFLTVFLLVSVVASSQRSKTKTQLAELVDQINAGIRQADNRQLAGDTEAANALLQRAEEQAKQVIASETGLFKVEASDLLDKIRSQREQLQNIVRLSPRVNVNLSAKAPQVVAQGLVGISDGELVAYDRRDAYRILLNQLDDPKRVTEEDLLLQGNWFSRFRTLVFTTTGNGLVEMAGSDVVSMKTEDPAGWVTGKDIETYLRYLYILVPDKNQIYKYERLNERYSQPVPYNVSGDLSGALDMTIDGDVYVLKEGGAVIRLFRGESKPFAIRQAPTDILKTATKIFKVPGKNFYFLDPEYNRVIVATDPGSTGESAYVRQYVLEGEQLGTLQDLYVDPIENHLYVIDDKRVYQVDMGLR